MSTQYTGKDFSQTTKTGADAVGIDDLDELADRSMPLCMRVGGCMGELVCVVDRGISGWARSHGAHRTPTYPLSYIAACQHTTNK